MHSASLLVAALLMLRRPCARNRITATMLLARADRDTVLSPAEREACLSLVDELERDAPSVPLVQRGATQRPEHRHDTQSFDWTAAI